MRHLFLKYLYLLIPLVLITSAEEGGYVFGSICCITSRREWALLLFQDVCLDVCLSFRDLQPTMIDRS